MNLKYDVFRRKKIFLPLLISASIFTLVMCEDEKAEEREYPRLTGTNVTYISDSGATYIADLYSLGTEAIEEHGFIWSNSQDLHSIEHCERIFLGKPGKKGVFTARISTALLENQQYFVRPFVKTENRFVLGPITDFMSLGSNAPVITGFKPDSAGWGDTLVIYGKNFSWRENEISITDALFSSI